MTAVEHEHAAAPMRSGVPDLSAARDLVHGITRALESAGIWDAVEEAQVAIDAHEAGLAADERPWAVVSDLSRIVYALQDVRGVIDQRAQEGNAPPEHAPSGSRGEPAVAPSPDVSGVVPGEAEKIARTSEADASLERVVLVALGAVLMRYPAVGLPEHTDRHVRGVHPRIVAHGELRPSSLFPAFASVLGALENDFLEVEGDLISRTDPLAFEGALELTDRDGPAHRQRLIAARVCHDVGIAIPVALPIHVVALLDSFKRTPRQLVRILCQLTRLYSSALDRLDVEPEVEELLLESLRTLVGALRATTRGPSL